MTTQYTMFCIIKSFCNTWQYLMLPLICDENVFPLFWSENDVMSILHFLLSSCIIHHSYIKSSLTHHNTWCSTILSQTAIHGIEFNQTTIRHNIFVSLYSHQVALIGFYFTWWTIDHNTAIHGGYTFPSLVPWYALAIHFRLHLPLSFY